MISADDGMVSINFDLPTICAKVGFQGDPSGTFMLAIPKKPAASITADFLGTVQEELSSEQITGTVKEMINMLAGNSLSAYDIESPFNLEIPELVSAPDGNGKSNSERDYSIDIGIDTLDNRMTLHMTVQEVVAA